MTSNVAGIENPGDLYNEAYYRTHCGPLPYSRESPEIVAFFSAIAEQLVRSINPRTVLDAGCAMGFLVEALRDRGVDAWGIDISHYAISQIRMDIRTNCRVASLTEPISGHYDLITCIEVTEHMPEEEAIQAIANMALATETILFSSSLNDFTEPTHICVRQPMWWLAQFGTFGFAPDLLFDGGFISPQAMLLRKTDKPAAYESQRAFSNLLHLRNRVSQLTEESLRTRQALDIGRATEAELAGLREQYRIAATERTSQSEQIAGLKETVSQLSAQLSDRSAHLAAAENQVAALGASLADSQSELTALREKHQAAEDHIVKQNERILQLSANVLELTNNLLERTGQLTESETRTADLKAQLAGLQTEMSSLVEGYRLSKNDVASQAEKILQLTNRLGGKSRQIETPENQLATLPALPADVQTHEGSEGPLDNHTSKNDLSNTPLMGVGQDELARMQALVERCEQRGTVFLKHIEQSESAFQGLQRSVQEQSARWEHLLNIQKATSSNIENRCAQLTGKVQLLEPRVADTQKRIEELTRLHLSMHQQVNAVAAQVRDIVTSRIWQSLVKGGALLLKLTGNR
jgi:SAM-dependent methyltransferase